MKRKPGAITLPFRIGLILPVFLFASVSLCLTEACAQAPRVPAQASRASSAPSAAEAEQFQQGAEALRSNHLDEAIVTFQQLTRSAPRFAEAFLNLGLSLSEAGRNADAQVALQRAVLLKPAMRGAHLFLAIAEYKLGQFAPAAAAARKETSLFPVDAKAWMWQGIVDSAEGDLQAAVASLNRAAELAPDDVDILYHRGRTALALSRQSYERMFKVDPKSWHVHQVLAEADVESNQDAEAVGEFKLAIAGAPPQSGLYEALGSSLWRTGKFEEAEGAYAEALKIDPDDVLTMYKLGCLRVDRSDAAGGKALLDRVLVTDPSLKMTRYYLGRAELLLGNAAAAVADFKSTIDANVDAETTRQAYFQLSRAYRRLHDTAASEAAQAQYRTLDLQAKQAMVEASVSRKARADRDTNLPVPLSDARGEQP